MGSSFAKIENQEKEVIVKVEVGIFVKFFAIK